MESRYDVATEEDIPALAQMMAWSFAFPTADAEPWLRRAGVENVRVMRRGRVLDACLLLIPHGQFFHGRSVPAYGLAGVATPAESRGSGAALVLLRAALSEMAERGIATSNLYPATLSLYRRVGYEIAGARWEHSTPLARLPTPDRSLPLRDATPDDRAGIEACYREKAAFTNGMLDRGPYVWQRVFEPRGQSARSFVVGERGRIDGYTVVYEKRGDSFLDYSLVTTDLVARTPAAVARLLAFFADHGTLGDALTWCGAPSDPFVHALRSVVYTTRMQHSWMIRIVDVAKALEARGYPAGLTSSIDLEVRDELLGANAGRFVLQVEGGRGHVTRGGRGSMTLDVGALAALYSGHLPPRALAVAGALAAPDDDLARAESIFASAAPSMSDFF
jgi:predicted acetyltransferase